MFKGRDNTMHPPFTVDPQGSGVTMKAVRFAQQQQQQQYGAVDMASAPRGAAAAAAAGRKRPRDIRGIDRFKQVVYGDKGLPRFHAMITRNPILMYPPEGTQTARETVQMKRKETAGADAARGMGKRSEDEDEMLWVMFEERRAAEDAAIRFEEGALDSVDARLQQGEEDDTCIQATTSQKEEKQHAVTSTVAAAAAAAAGQISDEDLAKYHHQQLDALIGLYYEFNHLTFMKLPMNDTLRLLQRCGKDAMAHTVELEMQLRMRRETRLKELEALLVEERQLKQRQLEAQEMALEMQVRAAEEAQRTLAAENGVTTTPP